MSQVEDFNLAKALREKLREVEDRLARNANRSPVSRADEQEMTAMQARADEVYVKANRRAPPPLPYERPGQFRRRLAAGLQEYSPRLQGVELRRSPMTAAAVEAQIFADAVAKGRRQAFVLARCDRSRKSPKGGHRWLEFIGGPGMHFQQGACPAGSLRKAAALGRVRADGA